MASFEGIINHINTGNAVKKSGSNLDEESKKENSKFKYRFVRALSVVAVFIVSTCISPLFIVHKSFSILINEYHYFISKEIAKHNSKVVLQSNNDAKNYNNLFANIIKVIFIQLLLSPSYLLYGIFFAYFDLINYTLNYITKEKNYYILEKYRPL